MIDGDDCGAINGMNEWQKKPKYSEEIWSSEAVHHRSLMTSSGLERAAAVGSQRLIARATVRPSSGLVHTQPKKL
jgi:hypothetical protein